MPKKCGFTLAEVLITLGIIGVVAALTLPSLIMKQNEKQTVVKLKKMNSVLNQGFKLSEMENGPVENWFTGDDKAANSKIFAEKIIPYLKLTKDCGFGEGCFQKGILLTLNGNNYHDYDKMTTEYKVILSDGTMLIFYSTGCQSSTFCGNIKVDVDGFKGEHAWGKDTFIFNLAPKGIVPNGIQDDKGDFTSSFKENCNINSSGYENGIACAAWVIYNENMDYLHCDDLNWDTKTKCK